MAVRFDPFAQELLGEPVRAMLGSHEHQHLAPIVGLDQMREQVALLVGLHRVHHLRHQLGRRVAARDLDGQRVLHERGGELADLLREGRREEQVLALRRKQREDAPDVVDESHVEHPVAFVEHQDLHLAQVDRLLLHMVEQPARRSDQDVHAAAQRVDLRLHADPAVHQGRFQVHVLAIGADAFFHLRGELPGRRNDQRPHRVTRRRMAPIRSGGKSLQ